LIQSPLDLEFQATAPEIDVFEAILARKGERVNEGTAKRLAADAMRFLTMRTT
jgi:hypothetical protein